MLEFFKYLNIPHVKGGRDIKNGLDCWGLIVYFYKEEFGINLPTYTHIDTGTNSLENCSSLLQATTCYKNFSIVPCSKEDKDFNNVQYGDIIVFNIGGNPIHTSIAINKKDMLHSQVDCSKIERFTDNTWITRLRSIHRYES